MIRLVGLSFAIFLILTTPDALAQRDPSGDAFADPYRDGELNEPGAVEENNALGEVNARVDSDNDSRQILRPPSGIDSEDDEEWRVSFPADDPPGLRMYQGEHWATIQIAATVRKAGSFRLYATADDIEFEFADSKFQILSKRGGKHKEIDKVKNVPVGDFHRTYYVRPTAEAAEHQYVRVFAEIVAINENLKAEDSFVVSVSGHMDLDTNHDEIVYMAFDLDTFGNDTGMMFRELERPEPQLCFALAMSRWDVLPVHAYISQGGFHHQRNTYWKHPQMSPEGSWLAYSLHTRVEDAWEQTDLENPQKIVNIIRPRGNVVQFKFDWIPPHGKETEGKFSARGYPQGVNARRSYVLRDMTPDKANDNAYELTFASGITHEFDPNSGLLSHVRHTGGRRLAVDKLTGIKLTPNGNPQVAVGPRYTVNIDWKGGLMNYIEYTDRASGKKLKTQLSYGDAQDGEED